MADTKMQTVDFLDAVKEAYSLTSDYQLAKKLAVSQPTISGYRAKRSFINDEIALRVAHLLELDPLIVIACAQAERYMTQGSDEVFNFWADLAEKAIKDSDNLSHDEAA